MSNYSEAIGFVQFWGFSPQLNLVQEHQKGEVNILLSGVSDLRHLMETCMINYKRQDLKLNFYIHERYKETVCRSLLLLLVIHATNLSYKERMDIFLEIFANSFVREQTQNLIDKLVPFLDDLVSKETKFQSALNTLADLKELKFKDRDEMVEVFHSWFSYQDFKMDKLRDTRLRHHYGTRYDFRINLIDWDYQMNLKEWSPIVHFYHYREWRQSGIAYESRFSSYPTPNRTLASYLPGKHKTTKDSLLVRGYWGDIVVSPYFCFGIKCSVEPERTELFKVRNMQQVSHAVTVSEFNVQHMIQKFETLTEYHMNFEDHAPKQEKQEGGEKEEKKQANQKHKKAKQVNKEMEQIKEEAEGDDQSVDEDDPEVDQTKDTDVTKDHKEPGAEEQEIEKPGQREQPQNEKESEEPGSLRQTQEKTVEIITKEQVAVQIAQEPLQVFSNLKVRIIPIFDEFDKVCQKKKFQGFFDCGVLGFMSSVNLKSQNLKALFKDEGLLYVETAQHLVPFRKEERQQACENIEKMGLAAGWKSVNKQDPDYLVFKST